jgi:hypothetical protein
MRPIPAPPPRVFNYSLDWRFLLPMGDPKNLYLVFEEDIDFRQTLERVGIHAAQQLSFTDLQDRKRDRFPVLVLPFGFPTRVQADPVELYFSLRRHIESSGYLLVGFNNVLNLGARSQTKYQSSTPRRIARELMQAGFTSVKIYGAMPNLQIPEYMFELDPRAIRFASQSRFRRKPRVLLALQLLARTVGWKRLSHFLPSYFAVGTA